MHWKSRLRVLTMRHGVWMLLTLWGWTAMAQAKDEASADAGKPTREFTETARWDFGSEEVSNLQSHGSVYRDQLGPRPPQFPDFEPSNLSVRFDGSGSRYYFPDPGDQSEFDFDNGDEITLEACLKVGAISGNQNVYVIGKGRTNAKGFARDNQNWALRLRELNGKICISFLFATPYQPGQSTGAHWHRWTSIEGLKPADGWHSIAVSYRFGDPSSIRGWIDGKPSKGRWDMGGETKQSPVIDNDAIWIGSSMGGSPGNSFRGWLDFVGIYRGMLTDKEMAKRFRTTPREAVVATEPEMETVAGKVVVAFDESPDSHRDWPEDSFVDPVFSSGSRPKVPNWQTEQFLIPRLPYRYDTWGIRDTWKSAVLVRAAADVHFAAGKTRTLIRARGLSRLWVDGNVVAKLGPMSGSTDGHQPVDPLPDPPAPGMRIVDYGLKEAFGEVEFAKPTTVRVVFETLVGGPSFRAEPGETMVAVQPPGTEHFELLRPSSDPGDRQNQWPANDSSDAVLTDENVLHQIAKTEVSLQQFDDRVRRQMASSQDDYWDERHQFARRHVAPSIQPESPSIDRFIAAKIDRSKTSQPSPRSDAPRSKTNDDHASIDFQKEVLPILRENCFRCHGETDEGGFKLDSRQSLLTGGDSAEPAIVVGDPHASALIARLITDDEGERMPPSKPLAKRDIDLLTKWVSLGARWDEAIDPEALQMGDPVDDETFLRRVHLDTIGIPPSEAESRAFLADRDPHKRSRVIDRLLRDPRWADHWISYWQDVLGENPNLLKPSLNNTGPFRWYLYEALRDNKPIDRMVTELVMLRGSQREGGTAGFGMAAENDAPLASRSIVMASAFLGMNLQCARCHDSPYHDTTQRDLFSLAAMMSRGKVTVPATSTVAPGFFEKNSGRESLIKVTLKPGEPVVPKWPFEHLVNLQDTPHDLAQHPADTREQLAVAITSPMNRRFAGVIVNRLWKRLIGAGIVEPVDDWDSTAASHPELLEWLADELVRHDYDMKHVVRLILNSDLYQRQAIGNNRFAEPKHRFFASPDRRRLTAEQVVDSMVACSGRPLDVEELSFDPEARRPATTMISMGTPRRAWMFATLSNERDRPSLAFPRATAVVDVLEAFGWTGSRQSAINERDVEPNVLQPGAIANGVFASWIASASNASELAELAVTRQSPSSLLDSIYLRFLTRLPTEAERQTFEPVLANGFDSRLVPQSEQSEPVYPPMLGRVSWSNHLAAEANRIKIELEQRAREGDPADPRLVPEWRERYEDVVWAVFNSPEFVWIP
ncbi:DUF1553 domain-containing protein [Novipirellula caenicola]|uniref:Planctomycete cytochrome C n=1 Tax=Novipirellula caenicola TaxID=1536901 RepID=A0ABP9W1D9_9BACT